MREDDYPRLRVRREHWLARLSEANKYIAAPRVRVPWLRTGGCAAAGATVSGSKLAAWKALMAFLIASSPAALTDTAMSSLTGSPRYELLERLSLRQSSLRLVWRLPGAAAGALECCQLPLALGAVAAVLLQAGLKGFDVTGRH